MTVITSAIEFVRKDLKKILRFAMVSGFTVPLGMFLLWLFLQTSLDEVAANICAVTLSTIPNYILNRYWVWNKRSRNSLRGEVLPFWIMAFAGLVLSSLLVAIARVFTNLDIVFLAMNFFAFGVLWLVKFFVLEQYLFGGLQDGAAREVDNSMP